MWLLLFASPAWAGDNDVPPPPPSPHGTPVELGIDTSELGESKARRLGDELDAALRESLNEAGFEVVHDGADARIEAIVVETNVEMSDYAISFAVVIDGEREVVHDQAECSTCTDSQVVARSVELLVDARGRVPIDPPPPVVASSPVDLVEGDCDTDDLPGVRLGPIAFSGVVTTAGGAATVVGGIIVATFNPTLLTNDLTPQAVGAIVIGTGTLIAAGGVATLLIDMKVLEPRRRIDVALDVSRSRAGISLFGRF